MKRSRNKLTAAAVAKTKKPGIYPDGGGLYLQITKGIDGEPRKSWLFRFRSPTGRMREMGMGSAGNLELAQVRIKADAARKLVSDDIDPIEHRKAERLRRATEEATTVTFRQAAERFIDAHKGSWKNEKHQEQWSATLETYAYDHMGSVPVKLVDVNLVLKVIEPIWESKTETASRVRSRIERVLDWAQARGLRDGDNPARWRGRLENVLPARRMAQRVKHHAALPYAEIAEFLQELRRRRGVASRALEFTILTAARTGETLGARWSEIDLEKRLWTVPATRMKSGREHNVPLSNAAVGLLQTLKLDRSDDDWVFPGQKDGEPLSSMLSVLRQLNRTEVTVHGFRSTFRDWAADQTGIQHEVAEAALAHVVGNKAEAAYRRGTMLQKRAELMELWATYCERPRTPAESAPDVHSC
jgi:integrase